ncbi:site-specific integrase [Bacillus sp. OTU530]|uniref:site-specific integrase n=1 Tax=Bacillus sp. OTU530 TaxID=3043862 RepID=UPI00313C80CC
MKGHTYKRGKTWTYVVDTGYDEISGKRKQKTKGGFATKKEAQTALAKVVSEISEGSYVELSKETVENLLAMWLEMKKASLKETTFISYETSVKHIVYHLGRVTLEKLNATQIQRMCNTLANDLSSTTVNKIHNVLKRCLRYAVKIGMIQKNPAEFVDPQKEEPKELVVWDEQQAQHFMELTKKSRNHIAFVLALTTGMRKGEILGLRWQDIDFENKSLSIRQTLSPLNKIQTGGKTTAARRFISLPDMTLDALKQHRLRLKKEKLKMGEAYTDNDLVVCTRFGNVLGHNDLSDSFQLYLKRSGLPKIRFHDLRHTHATLLLKAGVHVKIVSERLGHTNIAITLNTYSHIMPGMQEEAVRKFEELFQTAK